MSWTITANASVVALFNQFKVDRLQIIVVAKNITVLQLFISRMRKMCAIPQLVSAPLNPIKSSQDLLVHGIRQYKFPG